MVDQIKGQRFATCDVVGAAGDLDQATAAILLAIAVRLGCIAQALGQCAGVVFTQVLIAAQFADVAELAGFMADLGDERRDAQRGDNGMSTHRRIQHRNKIAGIAAGVREYLQQLLLPQWYSPWHHGLARFW